MRQFVKWAAILATVAAGWTVIAPAIWQPDHTQALTNVLLGEFAALVLGHTAYRLTSGTDPSMSAALGGVLIGLVIALSPIVFGLVFGLTTSNMVCGGLVAVAGIASAVVARVQPVSRQSQRAGGDRSEVA